MTHIKRNKIPKTWPNSRKGTKWVVRPLSNAKKGIPVLVAIRDILKLAQNKKEVKKAINEKKILINNRPVRDFRESLLLFDRLEIPNTNKCYRLVLTKYKRFDLEEVKKEKSHYKISKIISKKTLKNKKTQLNLLDGRNFISNIKCNINDSVLINLEDKKIEKCIPIKEKSPVVVIEGKHTGKKGIINKINKQEKSVNLKLEEKNVNILIKQIMVVE